MKTAARNAAWVATVAVFTIAAMVGCSAVSPPTTNPGKAAAGPSAANKNAPSSPTNLIPTPRGSSSKDDPRAELSGPNGQVLSLAITPDQKTLIALNYAGAQEISEINLWDIETARKRSSFPTHKFCLLMAASADGTRVATGESTKIHVWDAVAGKEVATMKGEDGFDSVDSLAFSPDGATVAVGGYNGKIVLWDVAAK